MSSKWTNLFALVEEASKHPDRSTFARKKRNAYNAAKQANLLDALFPPTQWTMWKSIREAERFRSRSAFRKTSPKAYDAMLRNGLLESFFAPWQEEDKPMRKSAALTPTHNELAALEKIWK